MSKNLVIYNIRKLFGIKVVSKRAKFDLLNILTDYNKNYVIEYLYYRVS
jgi:hypothetical protein